MRPTSRRTAAAVTIALVALLLTPALAASAPAPGTEAAVEAALQHVQTQYATYGLEAGDVADLSVTDAYTSAHSGVTHVYLRQRRDGVDVAGANMTVNVAADLSVVSVGSRFLPLPDVSVMTPVLDASAAVAAAARALQAQPADALGSIPAKLVYERAGDQLRLAWNLDLAEASAEHWWNASVDAQTGQLLAVFDYVDHDRAEQTGAAIAHPADAAPAAATVAPQRAGDGASYNVYALPLESPNDGPRSVVTEPADALASPFGWHDTDGAEGPEHTITRGNNVNAYTDTHNLNQPLPATQPDGGASLTFDHSFDPMLPPPAYKDAAITNLFYWNNIVHDVFYRYGFDEDAGNFQVNNYDRGGVGNDEVQAEAQDGSGTNNANFATPVDGSKPRMQMYVWTPGNPAAAHLRDGDMDSGIITHEYGHGISNRLTGGPTTGGCLGSHDEREGEGWSDFLAIALTAREGDTGEQMRGLGTYALYSSSREAKGIRPTAYSTDMAVNPATYDTIRTAAEPHGVGYVWATMLWEVYWNLVAEYGFNPDVYGDWTTGGNNLAIQLVMDGMKMQPCQPGFVDARDAILAADVALTGGVNQCAIWRGFAKRGLGVSADQADFASKTDGTEAFDLPDGCG